MFHGSMVVRMKAEQKHVPKTIQDVEEQGLRVNASCENGKLQNGKWRKEKC